MSITHPPETGTQNPDPEDGQSHAAIIDRPDLPQPTVGELDQALIPELTAAIAGIGSNHPSATQPETAPDNHDDTRAAVAATTTGQGRGLLGMLRERPMAKAITIGAACITALTLGLGLRHGSSAEEETHTPVAAPISQTTNPATPSAEATPTPSATQETEAAQATPEPTATETSTPKTAEKMPESIKEYEEMSVDDFLKLPIEERLTYLSWYTRDASGFSDFINTWNEWNKGKSPSYPPADVDENTTAEEAMDYYATRARYALTTGNGNTTNNKFMIVDEERVRKCASALYLDLVRKQSPYKGYSEKVIDYALDNGGAAAPETMAYENFLPTTPLTSSTGWKMDSTPYGEFLSQTVTTTSTDGKEWTQTLVEVEYTDYLGNDRVAAVMSSAEKK